MNKIYEFLDWVFVHAPMGIRIFLAVCAALVITTTIMVVVHMLYWLVIAHPVYIWIAVLLGFIIWTYVSFKNRDK